MIAVDAHILRIVLAVLVRTSVYGPTILSTVRGTTVRIFEHVDVSFALLIPLNEDIFSTFKVIGWERVTDRLELRHWLEETV
jgi:hypothetical protein